MTGVQINILKTIATIKYFIRENATTEFDKLFINLNKRLNDLEFTVEIPR